MGKLSNMAIVSTNNRLPKPCIAAPIRQSALRLLKRSATRLFSSHWGISEPDSFTGTNIEINQAGAPFAERMYGKVVFGEISKSAILVKLEMLNSKIKRCFGFFSGDIRCSFSTFFQLMLTHRLYGNNQNKT